MASQNNSVSGRRRTVADVDETFDALAHSHRRTVIAALDRGGSMKLDALARRVAAADDSCSTGEAEVTLVHNHLPRLADAGVIEYDPDERRCELVEAHLATTVLDAIPP